MNGTYDTPVNFSPQKREPQLIEPCLAPVADLLDQRRALMEKLECVEATIDQIRRMVGA